MTSLTGADLTTNRLADFDAVVISIRAFNTRTDLVEHLSVLFAFVEAGGNVIAQYNRPGRDFVPDHDAAVVERLERAGAVMMGKLNMHELAYGVTSENPHFGAVRNPWNVEHSPGGSSGGSGAAVAAGMVYAAMGSDTGGSIRIPASFCGTGGLKPTYGRVSRYGAFPLAWSLDHMGPLARSVRDAAMVFDAIAGHDRRDAASSRHPQVETVPEVGCSIRGVRIGFAENFFFERLDVDVES